MNRYTLQLFAEISIHAPARGATATVHKNALLIMCKMPKCKL